MKIKLITWRDPTALGEGFVSWLNLDEVKELAEKSYNEYSYTCGIIVWETEEYIVVASTWTKGLYADLNLIYKSLIVSIK